MKVSEVRKYVPLQRIREPAPRVPVIRLAGLIAAAGRSPLRARGLTLEALAKPLERAFSVSHAKAVALAINSPGGAPAQSSLIAKRIRDLAAEKELPVLAFTEDVAASGGYWLACAADEIWADESSIVGSIGVVSASFGLQEFIQRYGIERRIHTAGDKKTLLDPFVAEAADDVERLKTLQEDIHDRFKSYVRERRGERLNGDEGDLFSGEFWSGRAALERGLIDGIGEIRAVLRERYGERVKLVPIRERHGWLGGRLGIGGAIGGDAGGAAVARMLATLTPDLVGRLIDAAEERAHWHRFGL